MKRIAKQSGSGGRLRWGLLMATVAAFLLVPIASASAANPPAFVEIEGEGSGWIKGVAPLQGEPMFECHWNGSEIDLGTGPIGPGGESGSAAQAGKCEAETNASSGLFGFKVKHEADSGSEFGSWQVIEGTAPGTCGPVVPQCSVVVFPGGQGKVKATFNLEPTKYALNLTPEGDGSLQCDTGSGAEACEAEYVEGTEVEVIANANTGSEFVEFGEDCSGSSCNLTMNAEHNVSAQFALESESFATTIEGSGEGTVECEVNAGPAEPCASSYLYGDEITVVATPEGGSSVPNGGLSGTGSASGCSAAVGPEEPASCTFTITEASSVTVEFAPASGEASVEGEVYGEVPQTTSLEGVGCEEGVFLGEFLPGVNANYANNCGITATSTGAVTTLTASDESAVHTGHLVQGSYFLPSALETKVGAGTYEGLETPVLLTTYSTPVSNQNETVWFRQHIGATDGLHTGPYAKTITLTLKQSTP